MSRIKLSHLKFWENTARNALLMEVAGVVAYAWAMKSVSAFAILFLVSLAATGGGGVLGFLFGIPRLKTETSLSIGGVYQPNSNLEQVSDWLTKVIIGATLVQMTDIARAIGNLSSSIGNEIATSGGAAAASSVMIFSFVGGFMWSYLWTSVRLKKELDGANLKVLAISSDGNS